MIEFIILILLIGLFAYNVIYKLVDFMLEIFKDSWQ